MSIDRDTLLVGIVGPCAAGKSTLLANLKEHGIQGRHIAQEHSYVPYMWQKITHPDVLVFLDVSYEVSKNRRNLDWSIKDYNEQVYRLRHARLHTDLYIQTDHLSIEDVTQKVLEYLDQRRQ